MSTPENAPQDDHGQNDQQDGQVSETTRMDETQAGGADATDKSTATAPSEAEETDLSGRDDV